MENNYSSEKIKQNVIVYHDSFQFYHKKAEPPAVIETPQPEIKIDPFIPKSHPEPNIITNPKPLEEPKNTLGYILFN
jgi:hypothetical protein